MYTYWFKRYFFVALVLSILLLIGFYFIPLIEGWVLYLLAFVLGGLLALALLAKYFTRRNYWMLYQNMRISKIPILIITIVMYELIVIGLILGAYYLGIF